MDWKANLELNQTLVTVEDDAIVGIAHAREINKAVVDVAQDVTPGAGFKVNLSVIFNVGLGRKMKEMYA